MPILLSARQERMIASLENARSNLRDIELVAANTGDNALGVIEHAQKIQSDLTAMSLEIKSFE